jgi:hypothetical protein
MVRNKKNPRKSVTRPARKAPTKTSWRQRLQTKPALVLIILVLAAGIMLLAPDNSPVSLASLTGRNSDRTAPKLDTLKGNYSVAGEAASTSLLVKYKSSVPETTKTTIHKQLNAKVKRKIGPLGVDIVQLNSTDSIGESISKYKARGEIDYVEPNYLAKRF